MNRTLLSMAICAGLRISNDGDESTIEDLNNSLLDLMESATNIQNRADAEKRRLTEDESNEIERINNEFEAIESEIERRKSIIDMQNRTRRTSAPRTVQDDATPADGGAGVAGAGVAGATAAAPARQTARRPDRFEQVEDRGKWGFRSFGEFLGAVRVGSIRGGSVDPRLTRNAATTYGQEGVGADGGFAVPPDFRTAIVTKVMGEQSLLSLTDGQTSSSNSFTVPADETTPWQSSGGIQAYWESEAGQITQSKPSLGSKTIKLVKLTALVPVTEELLADASSMASYVQSKAPEKMNFKVQAAIIAGTGGGQPNGIVPSAGTIVVNPESGQAADSIIFENINHMYYRVTPSARSGSVWIMHPDVEEKLPLMKFPTQANGFPVYLPGNNAAGAPFGTIYGRPIIVTEACPVLGDKGDIIFGNLKAYLSVTKNTGTVRVDTSMHFFFDQDLQAFRFIMRVGGQPWWDAPITGFQPGTNPRGFFVTLAARS